ncbi:tyrosine-type recombinase/integrase [Alcanivorax jadensis]|uniref:tyrosine-type recombinase/integrase n=1 Tax=Alcanivorax jadensis TaxID=64988 RepID=UPI0018DE7AFE|nr:tyrosine-type recombinase/integrase [Alcanivorax jadensis]
MPWVVDSTQTEIPDCPQIFRMDGEPWIEANVYAVQRLEAGKNIETVNALMNHLRDYAEFLEVENLDWRHFPQKKRQRCLVRYRGNLIERRDDGCLSPSTATARMSSVVAFYRWARREGLIDRKNLWEDQQKIIRRHTLIGLPRTLAVTSSDLAIPNRKRPGDSVEDGLLPLSDSARKTLLAFLNRQGMTELYLMFVIGFFTGARIETIRTLRLLTLDSARSDPSIPNLQRVPVGPPTPVKTKFRVSGDLLFPLPVIHLLQKYATSARRLARQAKADDEDRTLLFLTTRGRKYEDGSFTRLMSELRKNLVKSGLGEFERLKFHQTRATFGSQLMRLCIETMAHTDDAIVFVRDAMLHKNEATTWKYVKFVQNEPIKEKLADEFFDFFSGKETNPDALIDYVTNE